LLQFLDVKAKLTGLGGGQAAKTFTKKHCGAPLITPFKMVMGHGNGFHARPPQNHRDIRTIRPD
jgi:hypothetical protein